MTITATDIDKRASYSSKPPWLKISKSVKNHEIFNSTYDIIKKHNITTVCQEAGCPNINECWSKSHATFMIMGDVCTRRCTFCNVQTGKPTPLDIFEPVKIAKVVAQLQLRHVVITSVDRDDLDDGGASHIASTIRAVRYRNPDTTIEVLTPDFLRKPDSAIRDVISAKPEVFNHNIETVPRLYRDIRPGSRYFHSLRLLQQARELDEKVFTKSGLMVGLGETKNEVIQVMDDLRSANVDFLTIGQYLRPTPKHHEVYRYVTPDEFSYFEEVAINKGFLMVSSSPFTRSSYHADEDFIKIKKLRYTRQKPEHIK